MPHFKVSLEVRTAPSFSNWLGTFDGLLNGQIHPTCRAYKILLLPLNRYQQCVLNGWVVGIIHAVNNKSLRRHAISYLGKSKILKISRKLYAWKAEGSFAGAC